MSKQAPSIERLRTVGRRSAGADAYAQKRSGYFNGARPDFVALLPDGRGSSILEVGCGTGSTGRLALSEGKCARYCGVELLEEAAAIADSFLSEVVHGDVESVELPWGPESFDAVILSEVLEHLRDPWDVLRRLHRLLKTGGMVYASSPNVSHYHIIGMLLRGRWTLTDSGTMDRTHLRWFTPSSYTEMFEDTGFEVMVTRPLRPLSTKARLLTIVLGGSAQWLFFRQIVLIARKPF